ncbi:MAG: hypothetical protein M3Z11_03890 [Candidatus Dormibacteraeota bacterium]|nr:hypothetical protein [Candidatus Dormibacteraeota bacterium]
MAGPLSSANQEIREAEERERARRAAGARRPKRLTDMLLSQLEELNLEGVRAVPPRFDPLLGELVETLEAWPGAIARFRPLLRSGVSTPRMIETIFEVQDLIAPTRGRSDDPADAEASPLEATERRTWSVGGFGR